MLLVKVFRKNQLDTRYTGELASFALSVVVWIPLCTFCTPRTQISDFNACSRL
jgi:hypothetical protein